MEQPRTPTGTAAGRGLARATVLGFMGEALVFPFGLVTSVFLTRTLGADRYGDLSLVYAAVSPVVWLASTTFAGRAGVKLLADGADWTAMGATLLRANLVLGTGAMILFGACTPLVAGALHRPELAPLLAAAAIEIALLPVSRLHRDALMATGAYSWPAVGTAVYHTARLAMVLALVLAGLGIIGVVVANLLARVAELAVWRVRLPVPFRGGAPGGLRGSAIFLGALFGFALCTQVFNRIDLLLLAAMGTSSASLGYYGAAQNLAQAPGLLALVLSPLLIAALRRAEAGGDHAEGALLRARSSRVALGLWALTGPVAGGAPSLVRLLFGEGYAPAGMMLAWLAVGGGAWLVLSILSAQAVASGHHWRPLGAAVPSLASAVTLNVALIPRYGGMGAAWAMAVSAMIGAVIALAEGQGAVLVSRLGDLARAGLAGAAGFAVARATGGGGVLAPLDLLLGSAATVMALVTSGLVRADDLRRLFAEVTGRRSETIRMA